MFASYKFMRFISREIKMVNTLIASYCFSADSGHLFVKKARTLESLKSKEMLPQSVYEHGKYVLFLKSEMICLERNDKLLVKGYKEVQSLKKYGDTKTVLLDVLLDSSEEACLFAVDFDVTTETDVEKIETEVDGKFVNIRQSLYFMDQRDSQYATHARGLINFCKTYNFCCFCGGSLKVKEGGYQKQCISCKFTHYPNLAPIGLTLIEDEKHEEVLLIRQQRHPPGMYTCVAGFIEPGESLEENVKREVAEEVGLRIHNVEFCTSQHWALPSCQLTLGCIATCHDKTADIDAKEILDSKWVKAEELMNAILRVRNVRSISEINEKQLWAPPRNALSHQIMVAWLKKYHNFEPSTKS